MLYYQLTTEETLDALASTPEGLSRTVAKKRFEKYGANSIRIKGTPLWRKLIEPFADVFMLVLFIAAVLSILHHTPIDAVIIIGIMLVSAIIYYVQRFSTDRVLKSLQKHSTQDVSVRRDGKLRRIPAEQLVPGDILLLTEGEKVPADARLLEGAGVRVDEALLTGESEPITKTVDALKGEKQIYERSNL
jgi:Ca2+-transporting ATPase